ncbi:spore coat protein [Risungbinella massiliensis]|uniref:spore coat protein n=1 Tax=Risungbinella massiliensis TaxID=1329796 RepID=UPI00069C2F13|nr:spore coat protein [Risungbinella massiliensis]
MDLTQQTGLNPAPNLQQGMVARNHSGHEVNDVHELLSGTIGVLDQYMMFRQYVQCQELLGILDRQYQFMMDEYNMLVQCFHTGQDPQHGTKRYQMHQSNENIVYGIKPGQPKKPAQSLAEISSQHISGYMLGHVKSMAGMKAVAATEITNPVVRRVVADSVPNCIEMAYELFLYQNKNGYYPLPQYNEQDMKMMQNAYAPAQGMPQMPQPQMMQ